MAEMKRSPAPEIMDNPEMPEETMSVVHRNIVRVSRYLGNIDILETALRDDDCPVRSVLDIGCGHGGVLMELQKRLAIQAVGVDLRPPKVKAPGIQIVQGDAVHDPLPKYDVAIATYLMHHLPDEHVIRLIKNVGRSCRRFIFIEPVRSRVPLVLFRLFVGPFLNPINAFDGAQSIRRAHAPAELHQLVTRTLAGSGATFRHSTAHLYTRQIVDIRYHPTQVRSLR
jgi:SAM-dependent methyltransferase